MSLTEEFHEFARQSGHGSDDTDSSDVSGVNRRVSSSVEEKPEGLKVDQRQGPQTEEVIRNYLSERGYDPTKYQLIGLRSSEWTMANGELGTSTRYSLERVDQDDSEAAARAATVAQVSELVDEIRHHQPHYVPVEKKDSCYVVAVGDMQIGKTIESPTVEVVQRFTDCIDGAYYRWVEGGATGEVLLAFLGDHIEGFESQGGNNAWRTQMPLTQQIRVVRQLVMYAVKKFSSASHLVVAAVPGNHGEAKRFGKGVTTYDDSFDTDAILAVGEAFELAGGYDNIQFVVPEFDKLTVSLELGGTSFLLAHGHQWARGKFFDWWSGQSFDRELGEHAHDAGILMAGHLHHLLMQEKGSRTFIQVPAMETMSQWWQNKTGDNGNPGLVTFTTLNDKIYNFEVIR